MIRLTIALAATLLLVLLAGCGTSPASVFPQRPVDLPIAELDPCAMLDGAQKRSLHIRNERPTRPTVDGLPSAGCVWHAPPSLSYLVQTFPIAAEQAVTGPGAVVVQIDGFGAVRSVEKIMTGGAPNCQVTIDAAPAAAIRVQARGSGAQGDTDDEMCRRVTDMATMVMTTVLATHG